MSEMEGVDKTDLLGQILVRRKLISFQQLHEALEIQGKEGGFIGEILVRLGYLEEKDIVTALIVQCHFPYIAIDKYDIEKNILQLVPGDFAKKHHVIPLDRVGEVLSVVMLNPLDQAVVAELARITKFRIASFIATRAEIERAVARWYNEGGEA